MTNCMAGHIQDGCAEGTFRIVLQVLVHALKFFNLMVSPHVSLYHADRRQIFLNDPVDFIHRSLHHRVHGTYSGNDQEQQNPQKRRGNEKDQRQFWVQIKRDRQ